MEKGLNELSSKALQSLQLSNFCLRQEQLELGD